MTSWDRGAQTRPTRRPGTWVRQLTRLAALVREGDESVKQLAGFCA